MITKNAGLVFKKPLPGAVADASRSFTIIPHQCPREEAPVGFAGSEIVTELWIERCLAANTTFNPSDLVMCKLMPGPFPRPCMSLPYSIHYIRVASDVLQATGFDGRFTEHCILYNRVFRPGSIASGETDCVNGRGLLREFDAESEFVAYV